MTMQITTNQVERYVKVESDSIDTVSYIKDKLLAINSVRITPLPSSKTALMSE